MWIVILQCDLNIEEVKEMLKPGGFLLSLEFLTDVKLEEGQNVCHNMEVVYSVRDAVQTLRLLRMKAADGS